MYKTIVMHVDDSPYQESRLRAVSSLAADWNAHVVASASTGFSERDYLVMDSAFAGAPPIARYEDLRNAARARLERCAEQARRQGIESIETRVIDADSEQALLLQSRYADLVVVSQFPSASEPLHIVTELPEYVALHGTRPVLVVPARYDGARIGGKVVLAWNGSKEATRAAAAALPLLQRAECVYLAIVNPDMLSGVFEEPVGDDMALYLARHGINVELVRERTERPAEEALLALARDVGADVLVAGAFGHSRYREWILGGVTRGLLDRSPIPLLLAH
jgi:nucleotide-binding universal stress UspA family protein